MAGLRVYRPGGSSPLERFLSVLRLTDVSSVFGELILTTYPEDV